ncbi:hypothetical protein KEM48_006347 [Puccinia striiformis f. sp. tritici PST-130]|nr:hypothetical protein KEM48_006347 [Puccinia striiformis f. sp. tritici PST-130]
MTAQEFTPLELGDVENFFLDARATKAVATEVLGEPLECSDAVNDSVRNGITPPRTRTAWRRDSASTILVMELDSTLIARDG